MILIKRAFLYIIASLLFSLLFVVLPPMQRENSIHILPTESKIIWTGSKSSGSSHTGTISLKSGHISSWSTTSKDTGHFVLNMESIQNTDIEDPQYNNILVRHLKSDDFFAVDSFPNAYFDLTNIVPSVATTVGAIAMPAAKGPVSDITVIGSEEDLLQVFGKPNSSNFEWWFTAASFLQYSDQLKVVRPASGFLNAGEASGVLIKNDTIYLDDYWSESGDGQVTSNDWYARTAGTWGNSLGLQVCPSSTCYEQHLGTNNLVNQSDVAIGDTTIDVDDADKANYAFNVGDLISFSSADSSSDSTAFAFTSGDEGNELADTLCNCAIDEYELQHVVMK